MKKYPVIAFILLFSLSIALAAQPNFVPSSVNPSNGPASVIIPENAVEVAPGVFSLGTDVDVDGRIVEGFMFIDNKKGNAKPGTECGNGICEAGENANKCPADCTGSGGGTSSCFSLLASGARWKTTEQYITGSGIDTTVTEISLNTWDSEVLFDIFGARNTSGVVDGADSNSPDGKNEVLFENLGSTNTIAVTTVWGIFIGPPSQRELVEWDAVFNTAYHFGNADLNSSLMDYQNIAVHEFGHALGLGHPADECTEETMYRFADFGETKKRTLEAGDIAGINKLYG